MVSYKLTYFDGRGAGEICRQIFAFADQKYEDNRLTDEQWEEFKAAGKAPYNQLPMLEVDGKPLAQSHAMARYLAREFGINGKTTWEEAQVNSLADQYIHKKNFKRDTVYLYQYKRLKNCPNLSPFCMKIEILCRIYSIPYEIIECTTIRSRNGLLPFIELNGEHIADSDLIEIRLKSHFKIPALLTNLEAQSVALSKMADHHLFFVLIRFKTAVNAFYETLIGNLGIPPFLSPVFIPILKTLVGKSVYTRCVGAIGDFEWNELDELLHRDLEVVQNSMKGKFLFGDKATAADATVFSQLATVYYPFRTHISDVLEKDFPKILEYCERVRKEVYPNDFTV